MNMQINHPKYIKRSLFGAFMIGIGLILITGFPEKSCAGIAASPCDAGYYQSLEQRAWLEAQREITQNQNLIFKPDSVLAYTCFEGYLFELADHADEMFSENTRWGSDVLGTSPPQDRHMNRALEELVSRAMITYLDSNFAIGGNRFLLGHRLDTLQYTDTSTYFPIDNNRSYSCNIMQEVWMASKCYNFQGQTQDGFFTFEWYADPSLPRRRGHRPLPAHCASSEPHTLYRAAIDAAGLNPASLPTTWARDNTLTYIRNFDASNCGDITNFPPIATGVTVRRQNQDPQNYFEGVCIQPGCMYQPNDGASGTPTAGGTCVP
jgi:hypothetical protein